MTASTLHGADMFLFGVPLIFLLFVAFFRLDSLLVTPKSPRTASEQETISDRDSMYSDPDGRPWDHL